MNTETTDKTEATLAKFEAFSDKIVQKIRYQEWDSEADEQADFELLSRSLAFFAKRVDGMSLAQIKRVISAWADCHAFERGVRYGYDLSYRGFEGAILTLNRPYDSSVVVSGRSYAALLVEMSERF